MATIIPRWEWRTFGSRFGTAETRFAELKPTGVQESDELYLLAGTGHNVKIRDALLDIKVLREVDPYGLERWEPVMKQGFPLGAADMKNVFAALDLTAPALDRSDLHARPIPRRARRAERRVARRERSTSAGCDTRSGAVPRKSPRSRRRERPRGTIAIESEDASAVLAAVASVGLTCYFNTSYPRGLKALLDAAPERYAVIDAGTNSVKFHIAERVAGGSMRTVVDRAEMTRLGEGLVDGGDIGPEAIERNVTAIAAMAGEAKRNEALAIAAVGTAGLRMARNAHPSSRRSARARACRSR